MCAQKVSRNIVVNKQYYILSQTPVLAMRSFNSCVENSVLSNAIGILLTLFDRGNEVSTAGGSFNADILYGFSEKFVIKV